MSIGTRRPRAGAAEAPLAPAPGRAYAVPMTVTIHAELFDPRSFPLEPWWFERPESIHGLPHTRRVLIHTDAIARAVGLNPEEFEALVRAVAWHDIGRTQDGCDQAHGAKSVARLRELGLAQAIAPQILARVLFAIELHSTHDQTAVERAAALAGADSLLRVLWVLKDGDGLDRVRIGDLDPGQLRFPISRERVAEAWKLLEELP